MCQALRWVRVVGKAQSYPGSFFWWGRQSPQAFNSWLYFSPMIIDLKKTDFLRTSDSPPWPPMRITRVAFTHAGTRPHPRATESDSGRVQTVHSNTKPGLRSLPGPPQVPLDNLFTCSVSWNPPWLISMTDRGRLWTRHGSQPSPKQGTHRRMTWR